MAFIQKNNKKVELPDNYPIKEACMELDVPFGCQSGLCGTCKIDILEGAENLEELTPEEKEMGDRDYTHRLACQAKIKSGFIKIKPQWED